MESLLNQIEVLFDFLELDKKLFSQEKTILSNPEIQEIERETSIALLLTTVRSLIEDKSLKKFVSNDTKKGLKTLANDLDDAISATDLTEEDAIDLLSRVQQVGYEVFGRNFISKHLPKLKETVSQLDISDETSKLKEVNLDKKTVDENLDIIKKCLEEILHTLRLKAQKNARNRFNKKETESRHLEPAAKKRVDYVIYLSNQITDALESNAIDFEDLDKKLSNLLDIERKFNKMIELGIENRPSGMSAQNQTEQGENTQAQTEQGENTQTQTNGQGLAGQPQGPEANGNQPDDDFDDFDEEELNEGLDDEEPDEDLDDEDKKKKKKNKKKKSKKGWIIAGCSIAAGALLLGGGICIGHFVLNRSNGPISDPSLVDKLDKDDLAKELPEAVKLVYNNWQAHGIQITEAEVTELIKALNHIDSSMSFSDADIKVNEILNTVVAPHYNGTVTSVPDIDISSLILGNKNGLEAVEHMEDYLNGCLNDRANVASYAEQAFVAQAIVVGSDSVYDGLTADDQTDPALRALWARMAGFVNLYASDLGDDFTVIVNGKTFAQTELNDGTALNEVIQNAKKAMGQSEKRISLN